MIKKIFVNLAKFLVAAGLIFWLISSGKLDFSLLTELLKSPSIIFIVLAIYLADQVINAFRYLLILASKIQPPPSLGKIYIINWIGLFFSSVLPGSVTGDLVKIFYVKDMGKDLTKKFLIFSVLLDRVVGLTGLIIVGGISSVLFYSKLTALSPQIVHLVHTNIFLMLSATLCLALLFIAPNIGTNIFGKIGQIKALSNVAQKLSDLWKNLVEFRSTLVKLTVLGMLAQSVNALIFWILAKNYAEGASLDFTTVLSVFPIGQITMAIPIAPAGMGVGHAVFDKLLSFSQITNGASLFNIYFFFLISFNLMGIFSYIFYSGKTHKKVHLQDI